NRARDRLHAGDSPFPDSLCQTRVEKRVGKENDMNKSEMNEAVMKQFRSYQWKGRVLTTLALGVGLLSIGAGILLMWANAAVMFPEVNLMLQQPRVAKAGDTNSITPTIAGDLLRTLPDGTKLDSQTLVTLMQAKAMNVTSLAVTLLGVGTFL